MNEISVATTFLVGLFGSLHCLGMCGGISSAFGFAQKVPMTTLLTYNLGRVATYSALGACLGLFGQKAVVILPEVKLLLHGLASLLLIAMGLYISQWWMGLVVIEKMGGLVWRQVQPITRHLMPINTPFKALGLGLVWGMLPCGLVYSTLALSLSAANWHVAALMMFSFGLGTMPMMLVSGGLSRQVFSLLRDKNARTVAAIVVIAMGVVTFAIPLRHGNHSEHANHDAAVYSEKAYDEQIHGH